ncbi:DUF6343 family protein [Kitasatospora aureofaciens]|uniref:Uncharacterized protein n=1 Tax=Kitasatospora aureofaciens TaxID=1894 RepID=A0A8H9LRD3_KITAU|nr:DUF6343 family protein [Kitasatospora aureofaciens]QEU98763.1 hypothetical protein CP971_05110 [Streptomyces viridifaciens]UKZ04751.1 DUF6343 family protein [Streptomyces viridifaciens]GGU75394.1 hypothetical protein GCM10010502_29260 [Kitasatospora aureofaciens]HJD85102.1 DUF6343 family protein [Kitasatospora aureofaciens]
MRTTTPRRWRSGTEPATARSDLKLRYLLAVTFTPLFALGTAGFALWAASSPVDGAPSRGTLTGFAIALGLVTLFAVVDLVVVIRRRRTEL